MRNQCFGKTNSALVYYQRRTEVSREWKFTMVANDCSTRISIPFSVSSAPVEKTLPSRHPNLSQLFDVVGACMNVTVVQSVCWFANIRNSVFTVMSPKTSYTYSLDDTSRIKVYVSTPYVSESSAKCRHRDLIHYSFILSCKRREVGVSQCVFTFLVVTAPTRP